VPLKRVLALMLHGNLDASAGLLRELLWRQVPVAWCSSSGRVTGRAVPARSPNGPGRVRQHVVSDQGHLGLTQEFIRAKVGNQATMLQRHGSAPKAVTVLRQLQRRAATASSITELFGIEGDPAARYFDNFATMLAPLLRERGLGFTTRTRRPARDPVNAALNFCYGLLLGDLIRAIVACGLDPHAGFLHSSGRNKPALALDLCEEFRAPVADSVVLGAFNNGELRVSDFTTITRSTQLRPTGRSALIAAYERRVSTTFQHPTFGYSVTWRRAMEIQARLVLGLLDGTQPSYKEIMIR
jgi:CRISPR-associated protein Cas1